MVTTEVTNVSYFSKVKNALFGVLIGLLMVGGSIWGLFSNEGRIDLSTLAIDAVEILKSEDLADKDGELVVLTGDIVLDAPLEDDLVSLEKGLVLKKKMEAYAWVEKSETKTEKKTGGSEKRTTTYTYEKKWVSKVPDSSRFKEPEAHENVDVVLENETMKADDFELLGMNFRTDGLRLPGSIDLPMDELNVKTLDYFVEGDYLYDGFGTLEEPEIGDVRISYSGVNDINRVSLFGNWNEALSDVVPFIGKRNAKLHGLYKGDKIVAMETMHKEYTTAKWGMRIGMLILMFVGFSMILAPLHAVLDVVPMLGNLGKGAAALVAFVLTLVIGGVVILLGKVWYSWILILIALGAIVGYFVLKRK